MILYVPTTLKPGSNAPTFMWIHGGSLIVGSATDPGLDGSNLAIATNSIVAVVQYRLGAFGWLAPNGPTNLAIRDLINAMTFLHKVVPSFGGSASKITIAGQSSGAHLVRALLAAPSASSLFQSAIVQSDPIVSFHSFTIITSKLIKSQDYGFLDTKSQSIIQSAFTSSTGCSASSTSCLNKLSVDDIINYQMNLFSSAFTLAPEAGQFEPFRTVHDGSLITTTLDSTSSFPKQSKPIMVTTVKDEAAFEIYQAYTDVLPEDQWMPAVNATFGMPRSNTIVKSTFYTPPGGTTQAANTDARTQLQLLGTDYLWKCASWTFAAEWTAAGGKAFVGMYTVGSSYPGNSDVSFCTEDGIVCHQDDIMIVFGTTSNPTSEQAALTTEMQARYSAFMNTGNPNPAASSRKKRTSYATWSAATSAAGKQNALTLGGSGLVDAGACNGFWGNTVQYDYQFYKI